MSMEFVHFLAAKTVANTSAPYVSTSFLLRTLWFDFIKWLLNIIFSFKKEKKYTQITLALT